MVVVVVVGEGWGLRSEQKKKQMHHSRLLFFSSPGVIHGSVFCLSPRLRPLRPHPRELPLFQMFKYNKHGPVFYYKYQCSFVFFMANP